MSGENEGAEAQVQSAEPQLETQLDEARGWLAKVRSMFEAIRPRPEYEIEDVFGNQYRFRPVIPAGPMMDASLVMDELVAGVPKHLVGKAREMAKDQGQIRAFIWLVATTVKDDETRKRIHLLWEIVNPRVLRAAQRAAQEEYADEPDHVPTHVLDLFEVDAIVEGIVPFFARAATKGADLMTKFVQTEDPASSPPSPMPASVRGSASSSPQATT